MSLCKAFWQISIFVHHAMPAPQNKEKAIAILTAERQKKTLSDVIRSGLVSEATRCGIMVNGAISEKYQSRVSAYRQVLEAERTISKREMPR